MLIAVIGLRLPIFLFFLFDILFAARKIVNHPPFCWVDWKLLNFLCLTYIQSGLFFCLHAIAGKKKTSTLFEFIE